MAKLSNQEKEYVLSRICAVQSRIDVCKIAIRQGLDSDLTNPQYRKMFNIKINELFYLINKLRDLDSLL